MSESAPNEVDAAAPRAADLFSPVKLGPYALTNRIVMAPLTRNRAGPGNVPQAITAAYYAQRASAGLIVTEATQVSPQGVGYPNTPGIHCPEQVAGWRRVTEAVHAVGDRLRADWALASGAGDLVAFGKPFIANPDLPERFRQDAPLDEPDPATFYRRRRARLHRLSGPRRAQHGGLKLGPRWKTTFWGRPLVDK